MPGRTYSAGTGYRYGFNGMENDNEVKGSGNQQDFGARIFDPRIARWLSVDPLQKKYPNESPYAFVSNAPILYKDADGRDKIITITIIGKDGTTTQIRKVDKGFTNNNYTYSGTERGVGVLYVSDTRQDLVIDLRQPRKSTYSSTEGPKKRVGWNDIFASESDSEGYGFRIYGNGHNGDWNKGLPKGSSGSESLDLGAWLDFVGGFRESDGVEDLTELIVEKLGGIKGKDMEQIALALDIMSNQIQNLTEAVAKIEEAKKNQAGSNESKPPNSNSAADSADCPTCTNRADSSHIDQVNGQGAFQKLKDDKKTDNTTDKSKKKS